MRGQKPARSTERSTWPGPSSSARSPRPTESEVDRSLGDVLSYMSVFDHREFDRHEQILFCHEERVGLFAIIAIHSTALGPAAGGCRMLPYATFDEARTHLLRLSGCMTYTHTLPRLH